MASNEPDGTSVARPWRRVFVGPSGVRAGWRLLGFLAILESLVECRGYVVRRAGGLDDVSVYVLNQTTRFLFCLAACAVLGRLERRTIADYGLPWRRAFRLRFWQGALLGFAALSGLLAALRVAGVFHLGAVALPGPEALKYAALYGSICLVIGFSEEFFYRGYAQFTAGAGIGFWPAAVLLSAYFGFNHLGRATESVLGALNAGLGGLVFCLFLRRTGDLWFAIGFHTSFNWAQIYFYGVPASGQAVPGHLFESRFAGPALLTGGTVGPEGSWLCTLLLLGIAAGFSARFREVRYRTPREEPGPGGAGSAL
jgi:hypothetical protein